MKSLNISPDYLQHSIHVVLTTHTQPFYDHFFRDYPGQPKKSSGLYGAREYNRGRHTNNPAGRHSVRINQPPTSLIPPFLRRMPFLPQPSQFILAWDKHQICWLAYPVAWFHVLLTTSSIYYCWRYHHTTPQLFTVLRPFFRNHPGEPMPEENFWTLWCKGRLTEADTQTI